MTKDKQQKDNPEMEAAAEAYLDPDRRIPESVQRRLAELNEGDHISTKRQQ